MDKFKEGSLVSLNSGGPLMTVDRIWDSGIISTIWFVNDEIHRDGFVKEQLILIRE